MFLLSGSAPMPLKVFFGLSWGLERGRLEGGLVRIKGGGLKL